MSEGQHCSVACGRGHEEAWQAGAQSDGACRGGSHGAMVAATEEACCCGSPGIVDHVRVLGCLQVPIVQRHLRMGDGRRRVARRHASVRVVSIVWLMVDKGRRPAGLRSALGTSRPPFVPRAVNAIRRRAHTWPRRRGGPSSALRSDQFGSALRRHPWRGNRRQLSRRHHGVSVGRRRVIRSERGGVRHCSREIFGTAYPRDRQKSTW